MTKSEARAIKECTDRATRGLAMYDWSDEVLTRYGLKTPDARKDFFERVLRDPLDEIKRIAEMASAEIERR